MDEHRTFTGVSDDDARKEHQERRDHVSAFLRQFQILTPWEQQQIADRIPLFVSQGVAGLSAGGAPDLRGATPVWTPSARTLTLDNVDECFRYHAFDAQQSDASAQVVDALIAVAKTVLRVVPDGPDRSVGLRKLREARMDFNSAITHRGRF